MVESICSSALEDQTTIRATSAWVLQSEVQETRMNGKRRNDAKA